MRISKYNIEIRSFKYINSIQYDTFYIIVRNHPRLNCDCIKCNDVDCKNCIFDHCSTFADCIKKINENL